MKLPKEHPNELQKDGFDWIVLKVIFKGLKKGHIWVFCHFLEIFIKTVFAYSFLGMILINCQNMDFI